MKIDMDAYIFANRIKYSKNKDENGKENKSVIIYKNMIIEIKYKDNTKDIYVILKDKNNKLEEYYLSNGMLHYHNIIIYDNKYIFIPIYNINNLRVVHMKNNYITFYKFNIFTKEIIEIKFETYNKNEILFVYNLPFYQFIKNDKMCFLSLRECRGSVVLNHRSIGKHNSGNPTILEHNENKITCALKSQAPVPQKFSHECKISYFNNCIYVLDNKIYKNKKIKIRMPFLFMINLENLRYYKIYEKYFDIHNTTIQSRKTDSINIWKDKDKFAKWALTKSVVRFSI